MQGGHPENPVVQVLSIGNKVISPTSDEVSYGITLSDGKYRTSLATFVSKVNDVITGADLSPFSIIKMKRYIISVRKISNPPAHEA